MGLFDFASNIGNKIFGSEDDASEKITSHVEGDNPGVQDIKADYKDGVVTLTGASDDPAAVEKAILMVGNIKGVKEVVNNTNQQVQEESAQVEYYVIESGDTLSKLAQKFYGDAMAYKRIFEANKEVIKDPNLIFVGQKIRIPLD
jgi:nucleoid-associated protein YgaU